MLRFVHISDTHITRDLHFNAEGASHTPLVGAKALAHQLRALPFAPDFVLHTGDLVHIADEPSYTLAREIMGNIPFPLYTVPGNHDTGVALQKYFVRVDNPVDPYDYVVEINGVRLVCMDSNRPAGIWRGRFSDAQLAWLESICTDDDPRPLVVALHHNPLKIGIPMWDEKLVLENGEDFHAILLHARDKIRGVFFGHVHQSTDILRDGILYTSALSSWGQSHAYPGQIETEPDRNAQPGFSVVTVTPTQTFIRRHTYTVDAGSLGASNK